MSSAGSVLVSRRPGPVAALVVFSTAEILIRVNSRCSKRHFRVCKHDYRLTVLRVPEFKVKWAGTWNSGFNAHRVSGYVTLLLDLRQGFNIVQIRSTPHLLDWSVVLIPNRSI